MKRFYHFWLVCISCLVANYGIAQNSINYGLFVGGNAATQFGDTYSDLGFRIGPAVGLYANKRINDDWWFETGLFYSQEGARNWNYDFSTFSTVIYNQIIAYDYLVIPLVAKKKQSDKIELFAGPRIGVRLRAAEIRKIKSGEPSPTDMSVGTRNLNQRIKLIYPGFIVGGQYQINPNLDLQATLYSSFFDNVKRNAGDSEGTYPIMVQIGVRHAISSAK